MASAQPDLIALYRAIAERGDQFRGLSVIQHRVEIGALIGATSARTLLDYGSGAGDAYLKPTLLHEFWGIEKPTLYDPAFAGIDAKPPPRRKFDGVIASDVMEHIPVEQCEAVVNELFGYARKFVWASICTRPAKKVFASGVNMHVTLRPMTWWFELFTRVAAGHQSIQFRLTETP